MGIDVTCAYKPTFDILSFKTGPENECKRMSSVILIKGLQLSTATLGQN